MSKKLAIFAGAVALVVTLGAGTATTLSAVTVAGQTQQIKTLQHKNSALAKNVDALTDDLDAIKSQLATAAARADRCADKSAAYKGAATSELEAFKTFLGGLFSGQQLDLSDANAYVVEANGIDC